MNFIIFNKRRMPETAILGLMVKKQDNDNPKPYIKIIICGKFEIVYFDSNEDMLKCVDKLNQDLKLVYMGTWYLKTRAVKEYVPVINREEYVFYISVKTIKGNIFKIRFSNEESLKEGLCNLDQIFNVK